MIDVGRVGSDADADVFVRLRNEIHPRDPISAELFASMRGRPRRLDVLARLDGDPAGIGSAGEHWVDPDGATGFVNVRVRRERRRRGVGTALLSALSEHARAVGWDDLYTIVPHDDGDSLAYFGARGWETVLEMEGLALALATAPSASDEKSLAGLELVRIEPALDRAVYEAALEVEPDLPTHEPVAPLPYERWRERHFRGRVRRDLSFAALDGDAVAGFALLEESLPGVGDHALTGVRRAYRGRGLARALKQAQIAAAKGAGFRELQAANTVSNLPMRRVNESLGYRRTFLHVHLRGPLA